MMKFIGIVITMILSFQFSCSDNAQNLDNPTEAYFGQTLPGDSAVIFAPGIISLPDRQEYSICFSSEGGACYFTAVDSDNVSKIFFTEYIDDTWTGQCPAPFADNTNTELSFVSADGHTIYYSKDGDIWIVDRNGDQWGASRHPDSPVNSDYTEAFYNESDMGTAFIYSNRPGNYGGNYNIWRIISGNDQSPQAACLDSVINTSNLQVTPCIAPDESYLIFSQPVNYWFRLFISFKEENGGWTTPVDMNITGAEINVLSQNCPTLSPDGKYLFFNRHDQTESGNVSDIYWISTKVIEQIKEKVKLNK
jgi:hypothetical protein